MPKRMGKRTRPGRGESAFSCTTRCVMWAVVKDKRERPQDRRKPCGLTGAALGRPYLMTGARVLHPRASTSTRRHTFG